MIWLWLVSFVLFAGALFAAWRGRWLPAPVTALACLGLFFWLLVGIDLNWRAHNIVIETRRPLPGGRYGVTLEGEPRYPLSHFLEEYKGRGIVHVRRRDAWGQWARAETMTGEQMARQQFAEQERKARKSISLFRYFAFFWRAREPLHKEAGEAWPGR